METVDITQPVQILANVLVAITVIITGCIALATLAYSAYCTVYCCTTWAMHVRDERNDEEYRTERQERRERHERHETIVHNLGPGVTVTCNTVEDSSEEGESEDDKTS